MFVIVTTCDLLLPTVTLPNASLLGLIASGPVPDPVSDTVALGLEPSLLTVSVALKLVAAFGVNETVRVVLCPAATDRGRDGDVRAKYLVEIDVPLMVRDAVPELVALTVRL